MGLQEGPNLGVHGVFGVNAPSVGGEHVGVRLLSPLGAIDVGASHRNALLLGVLSSQEEQRVLRDDPEGLRVGLLRRGDDRRRARLVVDHQWHKLVPVDPPFSVLQVETGVEAGRRIHILRRALACEVRDVGDGDRGLGGRGAEAVDPETRPIAPAVPTIIVVASNSRAMPTSKPRCHVGLYELDCLISVPSPRQLPIST